MDLTRSTRERSFWYAWKDEVAHDHLGIKWPQGHDLCQDCSKDYVKVMLSDPETMIPPKWQMWNFCMSRLTVEMQLDQVQYEMYLMYSAVKEVLEDEQINRCPFCKYFEVWLKSNSANFFYCHRDEWSKISCSICHKEALVPKEQYLAFEDDAKNEDEEMLNHFKWYEYKDLKAEFEEGIENGNKRFCPGCKIGGI